MYGANRSVNLPIAEAEADGGLYMPTTVITVFFAIQTLGAKNPKHFYTVIVLRTAELKQAYINCHTSSS